MRPLRSHASYGNRMQCELSIQKAAMTNKTKRMVPKAMSYSQYTVTGIVTGRKT
jgi:hypothetical protein